MPPHDGLPGARHSARRSDVCAQDHRLWYHAIIRSSVVLNLLYSWGIFLVNQRLGLRLWLLAALISPFASGGVSAQTLYDTPVYFAPNDTYYELVHIPTAYKGQFGRDETGWPQVRKLAASRVYKGRHGRLAIVKSKAVNDFLRDTFKPDMPAWIGLRFFCKYRKFVWVDGEVLKPGDYRNFGVVWNREAMGDVGRSKCSSVPGWQPVHYWPAINRGGWGSEAHMERFGFHWNANGFGKHWRLFFVEYPPPKKPKKAK